MRCAECGYQNDNGVKVCIKCGTKLTASSTPPSFSSPAAGGQPTVKGNISSQPAWDAGTANSIEPKSGGKEYHRCPGCSHYPLLNPVSEAHPCPNCQAAGATATGQADELNSPDPGNQGGNGPSSAKTARLENMSFGEETPSITLRDVRTNEPANFKGETVELNREKLDPDNDSISSSHAELEFKNGQWHIRDKSSNKATFIQVIGDAPLPRESTVIIGNKIYRVEYD